MEKTTETLTLIPGTRVERLAGPQGYVVKEGTRGTISEVIDHAQGAYQVRWDGREGSDFAAGSRLKALAAAAAS